MASELERRLTRSLLTFVIILVLVEDGLRDVRMIAKSALDAS